VAVPFGIETDLFSPARRDEALRCEILAACGAAPDAKLLIAVGRLHPEKRHRTIIDGFALARERRPDLALAIFGDGPDRAAVARRAAKVEGVHLAGPVKDRAKLAAIYASADLLVHGSGAETYGLVVAEAITSGLPVVTPDTGGAADLAKRGASATYATGDAGACADAICSLLAAREAGRCPVRALAPPSSADTHFTQLFELYGRLIESRRRSRDALAA
jgi:alpha-1,6-mannosyltransferase